WEAEFDCNRKMREWIIQTGIALPEEVDAIEREAKRSAKAARDRAWEAFMEEIRKDQHFVRETIQEAAADSAEKSALEEVKDELEKAINPTRLDNMRAAKKALRLLRHEVESSARQKLAQWITDQERENW